MYNPLLTPTLHFPVSRVLVWFVFLASASAGRATTYDVGPVSPHLPTLKSVPWATLQPGDIVNIHGQPGGYHEKIQISASGTQAAHIVIRGVPDPMTGALPIIDAKDAVEDPSIDWRNPVFSSLGVIVVSPRKAKYLYGQPGVSWVDIESLDIRNALYTADGSITYTDQTGAVRRYDGFACGIYIEWALDTAVRGCEISNCCNGLFANSKNLAAQSSQRLLIEKNYFHDNSLPYTADPNNPNVPISNGYHEHHVYTESAGITIQFNRFGQLHPNAHGCAIKDRSSGQVIRYNEFDMTEESNVLALLDPQGGTGFIDQQPDYRDAYVYGNLVTIENYTSSISAFWWGAYNSTNSYGSQHRGTLYFYDNTVVNHHASLSLFFLPSTTYTGNLPTYENVDCRNNVFFSDTTIQNSQYQTMCFSTGGATNGGGGITLGANWISPGWRKDSIGHAYGGTLTGTGNLLVGDSQGLNNPRFANANGRDYHALTGSNILDAGGPLAPSALPANDDVLEYLAPQSSQARVQLGAAMDLGAVESSGIAPPPPAGGALQFGAVAYSAAENAGPVVITVTRTGNGTGAVGVSYSTPAGGTATANGDYTPVSGVLNWANGDTAPKTFTVPLLNDTLTEPSETVNLILTGPFGGAVLGANNAATLTILDDDTAQPPPPTLIFGLTAGNAIIICMSNAPGTSLGFHAVTGMTYSGEILRGLAVQPGTGQLYAVSSASCVYRVDPFTGVATRVGAGPFSPALGSASLDLAFDRIGGALRVVNQAAQNLRIDAATGAVTAVDTPLAYAAGDAHAGTAPRVVGADYALSAGTETLYGIDEVADVLVRVGSVGGSPQSANAGQLTTIGALGLDTAGQTSLDIQPGTGFAWACFALSGGTTSGLYTVNLATGAATPLGTVGVADVLRDVVVAPPFAAWRLANFGTNAGISSIASDGADPDGDGIPNLSEYAFGTNPQSASLSGTPAVSSLNDHLQVTFTRALAATDATCTVEVSGDLANWVQGSSYSAGVATPDTAATTEISRVVAPGAETIVVADNTAMVGAAQRFMRVRVSRP